VCVGGYPCLLSRRAWTPVSQMKRVAQSPRISAANIAIEVDPLCVNICCRVVETVDVNSAAAKKFEAEEER